MVFMCAFCRLIPGQTGRRTGGGKLLLTSDNLPAIAMRFSKSNGQTTPSAQMSLKPRMVQQSAWNACRRISA
jgi:hypothetical protein